MKLQSRSTLLMIGDSITDCGRTHPVGQRQGRGLGDGYVSLVDALLVASHPHLDIRTLNLGISGNTVRDLKTRWQNDVLKHQPDWLSIMIGTNDVWRQFDRPDPPDTAVLPKEYEATLSQLVSQTRPTLKGLVLMTPFYVQPDSADAMRSMMDQYGAIVKRIAAANNAIFVDTQAAFNQAMMHHSPLMLAEDRVHPSLPGHMVLARAVMAGLAGDDE